MLVLFFNASNVKEQAFVLSSSAFELGDPCSSTYFVRETMDRSALLVENINLPNPVNSADFISGMDIASSILSNCHITISSTICIGRLCSLARASIICSLGDNSRFLIFILSRLWDMWNNINLENNSLISGNLYRRVNVNALSLLKK